MKSREEISMAEVKPKRGFALEGGGARGAYHMGVCKAYIEAGYEFHGVVGTSIGAINAAMLASGEFDKAIELWENTELEHLFEAEFLDVLKLDNNFPGNITAVFKKLISDRGVNHSKIKNFLASYINEEKVRASGCDFGLVTFSLNELKPYEIFLKDIPEGQLIDYILASAKFPFLTAQIIDDNRFFDGGVYNSCPINMLVEQEYDEIIAVRLKGFGRFRRYDKNANVTLIEADESLGHFLAFGAEKAKLNIKRGYCDGVKSLKKLIGINYYLETFDTTLITEKLLLLTEESLANLPFLKNSFGPKKRTLFEKTIPELADFLDLDSSFTYEAFIIAIFEFVALRKGIERFDVYKFEDFSKLIKVTVTPESGGLLKKVGIDFIEKKAEFIEQLVDLLI